MGLVSSACALPGDSVQDTNGAGCYAPNGLCYSLGKLDGDIVLSCATGFLMRPVPIHNGMMSVDTLYAGIRVRVPRQSAT